MLTNCSTVAIHRLFINLPFCFVKKTKTTTWNLETAQQQAADYV